MARAGMALCALAATGMVCLLAVIFVNQTMHVTAIIGAGAFAVAANLLTAFLLMMAARRRQLARRVDDT